MRDTVEPKDITPASHTIPHPVGDKGGWDQGEGTQVFFSRPGDSRAGSWEWDACGELATEKFRVQMRAEPLRNTELQPAGLGEMTEGRRLLSQVSCLSKVQN